MMNLSTLIKKIIPMCLVGCIFNKNIQAENYCLHFSDGFHYLLCLQEKIFEKTQNLLWHIRKTIFTKEELKNILSDNAFTPEFYEDYNLLRLTCAYIEAHRKGVLFPAEKIEAVRAVLQEYLHKILDKNIQCFTEYNLERIENFCSLIEPFLSFFEGHEEDPLTVVGVKIHQQPHRKLSSPY